MRRDLAAADEATVVALARLGNQAAFEELVRRRQSWLRHLLRRLCGDPALADDLAQQALLAAWRGIGGLRESRAFGAWLKRLAVHSWLDHARRRSPLDLQDPAGEDAVDEAPVAGAIDIAPESTIDLDRALAGLVPHVRLCIVLSYAEGMSHGEIADATGLPLGTVKSHIRRGLEQLRRVLTASPESRA
ncbi:MAG TPA: sigma-70 family RNA polymerase sigma factor [Vicinamibacterales bacterium]|nr:sigma-70 family RNA polymerase sigma factor [Vicinamibacterales bacterium]